ncbi:MAG: hypothetical protein HY722_12410 [Planctomycetes bacterium]|nr:hypothetical protein [Planctomycetota bacterium]
MVDLRTFSYIDILQPQTASFLATVSQGYLPVEEQASLFVEIAPGIEINRLTDVALKATEVQPGMQVVERTYGCLELHSFDQGQVRAAGEAILSRLGKTEADRLRPVVVSDTVITGVDAHQTMLVNRMRHGDMLLKGETLWVLEVHPAGYALIASNEAEKASPIKVLEFLSFGAFGRVYLGGTEAAIGECRRATLDTLASTGGRENDARG